MVRAMVSAKSKSLERSLTRRGVLLAAPFVSLGGCLALGGADLSAGLMGGTAPISMGAVGPFRSVYLTPRVDQSDVDAAIIYPYGERHNPYAEGLAHYLEHLVWKNVREAGADGGRHSNARTSPEATSYFLSRDPTALSNMINRLAASAAPLVVDDAYATQERDIVEREFDIYRLEDPMADTQTEMMSALFQDSVYSRQTLGTKSSIAQFNLESARQLHDKTHHIDTSTLHIRGPVTERDVRRAIAEIETWPEPRAQALPEAPEIWPASPADVGERRVAGLTSDKVIQVKSYLPPAGFNWAEIFAARNILESMAFSTKSGGLARPLRYDAFIARSFDLGIDSLGQAGMVFWLEAQPDQNVSLRELNAALDTELARLLNAPDREHFDEIKMRELSDLDQILDPLKVNDKRLNNALVFGAAYVPLADLRAAIQRMSFARFQAFTQHLLNPRSSVTRLISTN